MLLRESHSDGYIIRHGSNLRWFQAAFMFMEPTLTRVFHAFTLRNRLKFAALFVFYLDEFMPSLENSIRKAWKISTKKYFKNPLDRDSLEMTKWNTYHTWDTKEDVRKTWHTKNNIRDDRKYWAELLKERVAREESCRWLPFPSTDGRVRRLDRSVI